MLVETDLVAECLVAQLAGEGAATVGVAAPRMRLQTVRRREQLLTLCTNYHVTESMKNVYRSSYNENSIAITL